MAQTISTITTGNKVSNDGHFRQLGTSGSAMRALAALGITPDFADVTITQSFHLVAHEICEIAINQSASVASGTDSSGLFDQNAHIFQSSALGSIRRLGEVQKKIYSYLDMLGYARQEICDKLARAIYVSLTGTEGMEQNNKNEPWYWEISHNRWNISYHYPELMV